MMLASDDTDNDPLLGKSQQQQQQQHDNNNSDDEDGKATITSNNTSTSPSSNTTTGQQLALRIKSSSLNSPSSSRSNNNNREGDEVNIRIHDKSSIAQVKQAVRNALGDDARDRYLRLICKGRLLAPDSSSLSELSVRNGDVLHAVLAAAGVRGGQQAALARGISRRYRGTGVGAGGRVISRGSGGGNASDDDDDDDDDDDVDSLSGGPGDEEDQRGHHHNSHHLRRERLGFDRLRASGLSRSEINAIRAYFSRHVDRFLQAHPEIATEAASGEPDLRRRRLLQEDAWMQTQGPASEFRFNLSHHAATNFGGNNNNNNAVNPFLRLNTETAATAPLFRATSVGTDRDFLWGFLLGFFVGFLMLVWVWMPTVPHKQKLGILTGISFQLAMNFLKDSSGDGNHFNVDGEEDFVDGD